MSPDNSNQIEKSTLDMADQPSMQPPGGPPDGLSSINPIFYNTVISVVNGIRGLMLGLKGKAKQVNISKKLVLSGKDTTGDKKVKQKFSQPDTSFTPDSVRVDSTSSKRPKISSVSKSVVKKFILFLVVMFVLVGLVVSGSKLFESVGPNTPLIGNGNGEEEEGPTPTLPEVESSSPSIYAKDEVILKLEEDILVLDRELTITVLRESTLDPPKLDWNVKF